MRFISRPDRAARPRNSGITIVIDRGIPAGYFKDMILSYGHLIDYIKLGWGTALVTSRLREKVCFAHSHDIPVFFGGTLFEKAIVQDEVDQYERLCRDLDIRHVEISNGTIALSNREKARYVAQFSTGFTVFSEVGYKEEERSREMSPSSWIEFIREDLEAGAAKVILEARESGSSGICRGNGELRYGLIDEVLNSGIPAEDLIFEAPNKHLQAYFIGQLGPDANFGNIAPDDVIGLETLRLGLRSDTLHLFPRFISEAHPEPVEDVTLRSGQSAATLAKLDECAGSRVLPEPPSTLQWPPS